MFLVKDQHENNDESNLMYNNKSSNRSCEIEMRNYTNNIAFVAWVSNKGNLDNIEMLHPPNVVEVDYWEGISAHVNQMFVIFALEKEKSTFNKHVITVHSKWNVTIDRASPISSKLKKYEQQQKQEQKDNNSDNNATNILILFHVKYKN